ncbi:hypothetical protein BSKO_13992 [Bryopsis sp. KO-2023]|nr:hypothetical protein BSKO_13992 [Bryopsis sp. KO-2023]
MPLDDSSNSSALIGQIAQLFRDKEESDAFLAKERIARRTAEEEREDAEEERTKAENLRSVAEAHCRKLEELKSILEEQLEEERQRRLQSEKGVERMLGGLKDELLTPDQIARIEGDLRGQIASLQEAARKLRRDVQQEKVLKGKLEGNIQDLQGDLAKADRDRASLESELDDMRGRLKKMAELRSQIEAAKDQARKEVDDARRRAREQVEEERLHRSKAEDMYQDVLKEVAKNDQERRETGSMIEGLQKELDGERQKSQKLEEQKDILEAGQKEKDRTVAQANATLDTTSKELEEMRKDCSRLRNMLQDEKKQRDVAEEAWKEYSKRLHTERIAYTGSLGRLPDDEEIMDAVYDNLTGLERASSEEGEPSDYNLRASVPRGLPQHQQAAPPPAQQQQSLGLPVQTRRPPNRRGRNRAPPRPGLLSDRNRSVGPSSVKSGASMTSPSHVDAEKARPRSFQPAPTDPTAQQAPLPPTQPQQQQQPAPMSGFGQSGFVQVPMHGMRNPPGLNTINRPYSDMGNSSTHEEDGMYLNQSQSGYPVVHAREYQVQSPVNVGGRFRWTRHFNPMRIRSNPVAWVWDRRGNVGQSISGGTERVCRTTGKLAKSFWAWVVVLGLVAASVGLKDENEEERARNKEARRGDTYEMHDRENYSIIREEPVEYKAGSFVG